MTENIALLDLVIKGIQEVKGEDISVIDLRNIDNSVCDYFVICTGRSNTNCKAIADSVDKETEIGLDDTAWHIEGKQNAEWILMDYSELVVHIFTEEARDYYGLEDLWADAEITRITELVE